MLSLIRFSLRWLLRGLGLLLILFLVAVAFRDDLARSWLRQRIQTVTGLETELDSVQFRPETGSLGLMGLQLKNTAEFGGFPFLLAPNFEAELDFEALRKREFRFRKVRLNLAHLVVVRNPQGRTNLHALLEAVRARASALDALLVAPPGLDFAGIEMLDLTLGTLHLIDLGPPVTRRDVGINLTNEMVREVRTASDLGPLVMRVIVREISASLSNPRASGNPATPPKPLH